MPFFKKTKNGMYGSNKKRPERHGLEVADIKAIAKQVALEMYSLNDEVLSLSDVAIKLSKSEAAIKQMCYRGQLPFHKQHKTYYFSKNEITNFLLKKVNV